MREFLFRGKRKDIGEMVYGYLVMNKCSKSVNGRVIYYKRPEIIPIGEMGEADYDGDGNYYEYAVKPETVGQYTGRNIGEQKVFEGDILQNGTDVYIVCWDEKFLQWHVVNEKGNGCFNLNTLLTDEKRPCKLIGNVHDNPELLKGDKNETA